MEQIKSDLTEMERITKLVKENKTRTRQASNTMEDSWNLNKSTEDESQDEDTDFECPICFIQMAAPIQIFACSNDHLICSNCKEFCCTI